MLLHGTLHRAPARAQLGRSAARRPGVTSAPTARPAERSRPVRATEKVSTCAFAPLSPTLLARTHNRRMMRVRLIPSHCALLTSVFLVNCFPKPIEPEIIFEDEDGPADAAAVTGTSMPLIGCDCHTLVGNCGHHLGNITAGNSRRRLPDAALHLSPQDVPPQGPDDHLSAAQLELSRGRSPGHRKHPPGARRPRPRRAGGARCRRRGGRPGDRGAAAPPGTEGAPSLAGRSRTSPAPGRPRSSRR